MRKPRSKFNKNNYEALPGINPDGLSPKFKTRSDVKPRTAKDGNKFLHNIIKDMKSQGEMIHNASQLLNIRIDSLSKDTEQQNNSYNDSISNDNSGIDLPLLDVDNLEIKVEVIEGEENFETSVGVGSLDTANSWETQSLEAISNSDDGSNSWSCESRKEDAGSICCEDGVENYKACSISVDTKTFSCSECLACFETKMECENHKVAFHGDTVWNSRVKCDRKYKNESGLEEHKINHAKDARVDCEVCGETFRWRSSLRRHRKSCFLPNVSKQEAFSEKVKSKQHLGTSVSEATGDFVQESTKDFQTRSDNKTYSCPECFACFDTKKEIKTHKTAFHGDIVLYSCDKCDRKYKDKRDLQGHKSLHGEAATFACKFCPRKFHWRENLRVHGKIHGVPTARKPMSYSCTDCSETFTNKSEFQKHLRKSHPGPRSCKDCNEVFTTGRQLRTHRTRVHRKYVACQLCGRACPGLVGLKRHLVSHTNDRPFLCDMCPLAFSLKESLGRHKKIHTTTEPNFFCDLCGKSFLHKQYLIQHIRTHTYPFQCQICERRFCEHFTLVKHMKEHTESSR